MTKVVIKAADGTGAVESYHNANKKLETTSAGVTVTGNIAVTGTVDGRDLATDGTKLDGIAASATSVGGSTGVDFNDNVKVRFGTGNDLEIYHDGSHSFIKDAGTGNLRLGAADLRIQTEDFAENYILGTKNGSVDLYYDNAKTFETISNGVRIQANEGNSSIVELWADQGDDNSDKWKIIGADGIFFLQNYASGSWENNIKTISNGAVELYYDNSKKFETTSAGIKVNTDQNIHIAGSSTNVYITSNQLKYNRDSGSSYIDQYGTGDISFRTTPSGSQVERLKITSGGNVLIPNDSGKLQLGAGNDLEIYHDGSDSWIKDVGSGRLWISTNLLQVIDSTTNETMLKATENGAVELYYDNSKKLETTSGGVLATGNIETNEHISLTGDNKQLKFGAGVDLKIYSDGSNGILEGGGTGANAPILINGNTVRLQTQTGGEKYIDCQENGAVELYHNNSLKFRTYGDGAMSYGHIRPYLDDSYDLGINGARWDDVYASNGTIQTSDRNEKNTIVDTDLGLSFVNKLKPVSYKFNGKTRTHYGLIAQDIETTLSDISKPTTGFAGFIKEDIPDKLYEEEDEIPEGKKVGDLKTAAYTTYGLRYSEFISPLIKAVQELSEEVETLKTKVAALEAK